jgi:metal-responsive CopG/Arc/MetJ family transcriptional regulator
LVDIPIMAVRPVQISLDHDLLRRIDRDAETKKAGRSAFVRRAVELYLEAKRRREIDARIVAAFSGQADALLDEVEAMLSEQAWPAK